MDRFDNVATTMQYPSEEARTQSVPIWEVPMMGIPGLHELLESEGKKHKGKKRKKKKNHTKWNSFRIFQRMLSFLSTNKVIL